MSTATASKKSTDQAVGLFPVSYRIGTNLPGAPTFIVHFLVNTPQQHVSGLGEITQTTNPPLDIQTHLTGTYVKMAIRMPPNPEFFISVSAIGYAASVPPNSTIVMPPNVQLHMILTPDWQKGHASYRYVDNKGQWHDVTNAPVSIIHNPSTN